MTIKDTETVEASTTTTTTTTTTSLFDSLALSTATATTPESVRINAPATLREGATFDAVVDGISFTATVPKGGILQGESFVVPYPSSATNYTINNSDDLFATYMAGDAPQPPDPAAPSSKTPTPQELPPPPRVQDLQDAEIVVPTGQWRDGLFHCFRNASCILCCAGWYCNIVLQAQLLQRLDLTIWGRPRAEGSGANAMVNKIGVCRIFLVFVFGVYIFLIMAVEDRGFYFLSDVDLGCPGLGEDYCDMASYCAKKPEAFGSCDDALACCDLHTSGETATNSVGNTGNETDWETSGDGDDFDFWEEAFPEVEWGSFLPLSVAGLCWSLGIFFVCVCIRATMRRRYGLPGTFCGNNCCDDCCVTLCCACCSAIQMVQHTHDPKRYPYECASPTGLPEQAPAIV